jgi:hypothetical protein
MVSEPGYHPRNDEGLIYLPPDETWSGQVNGLLASQGYSPEERQVVLGQTTPADPGQLDVQWIHRVMLVLGLNWWDSGMPGGKWEGMTDENGLPWQTQGNWPAESAGGAAAVIDGPPIAAYAWVDADPTNYPEIQPLFDYPYGTPGDNKNRWSHWIWDHLVDDYTWPPHAGEEHYSVKHCFGIKTFVEFLNQVRPQHDMTPELAQTPQQPLQAVKDSVQVLLDTLSPPSDHLSLEVYGTFASHEVDLTREVHLVSDRLSGAFGIGGMQVNHYFGAATNLQGGILEALSSLTDRNPHADDEPSYPGQPDSGVPNGESARQTSRKHIVVLTDGLANFCMAGSVPSSDCSGYGSSDYPQFNGASAAAIEAAIQAAEAEITIHTISMGYATSAGTEAFSLMQTIAEIGDGEHYHVEGSAEDIQQGLAVAFESIAGRQVAVLIE